MHFIKTVLAFCIFCCSIFLTKAQVSNADSMYFNTVFINNGYINDVNNPGNWYLYPEITSKQNLFERLNAQFLFSNNDYYGSYASMQVDTLYPEQQVNSSMNAYFTTNANYAYKQLNPIFSLPFTLHHKTSKAYCTFTPSTNTTSSDCNTCYLMITGSGTHNGTELIRGEGYQNNMGFIKDSLKQIGDVYIAFRPLIDFRAFYRRLIPGGMPKVLNSEFPFPSQITNYLNNRGTPYGTNSLIESIALVKYLKSKYKKVIIAGLSFGGQYTLLNAFESEPEGCLISGGYTILVDETSSTNDYQTSHFGDLFYTLNRDSVKSKLLQTQTEFLFSWSTSGDVMQESQLHYTENYMNGTTNTQYFYNYPTHTFPPFLAFKNLRDSVALKAKASLKVLSTNCNPVEAICQVKICGVKPFSFDVFKDATFFAHYTSATDSMLLSFYQEGDFQIRNVTDSLGRVGFDSDVFTFKPNDHIQWHEVKRRFNCTTNRYDLAFALTENPPYTLIYSKDGILDTLQSILSDSLFVEWEPGNYVIQALKDAGTCTKIINDTIILRDSLWWSDVVESTGYDCDSSKVKSTLTPLFEHIHQLIGTRDGLPFSVHINQKCCWLQNGNYIFNSLIDSNGCSKSVQLTISIQEDSLTATMMNSDYDCDSNKQRIRFALMGKAPWEMYGYSNGTPTIFTTVQDTLSVYLGNGSHWFQTIQDQHGCVKNINYFESVANESIGINVSTPIFHCDSNKTKMDFAFSGKSPWVVNYTKNGIAQQLISAQAQSSLFFTNGNYQFQFIEDANGCVLSMNQNYQFQDSIPQVGSLLTAVNCQQNGLDLTLSLQGKAPYQIDYFKDGLPMQFITSNANEQLHLENGNYFFLQMTDANQCNVSIYEPLIFDYDTLSVNLQAPVYDCDSQKTKLQMSCIGEPPFTVYYTRNTIQQQFVSTQTSFDLYLENGNYQFDKVEDAFGCNKLIPLTFSVAAQVIQQAITSALYNCTNQTLDIQFGLQGNAPWYLHYQTTGSNPQLFVDTFLNANATLSLQNGNYLLSFIEDSTHCTSNINQSFTHSYTPLQVVLADSTFDCDSSKFQLHYTCAGDGPFDIFYRNMNTGLAYQKQSASPDIFVYLQNDEFCIDSIKDTKCVFVLNDTFHVAFQMLTTGLQDSTYSCDSNKHALTFVTHSSFPPYIYTYLQDGVQKQTVSYFDTATFYVDKGVYLFQYVQDANLCIANINLYFESDYSKLIYKGFKSTYLCDKDSVEVTFDVQYQDKAWVVVRKTSGTWQDTFALHQQSAFMLEPTYYIIESLYDNEQCVVTLINESMDLPYPKPNIAFLSRGTNCESKFYYSELSLSGVSPWQLVYIKDSQLDSVKFISSMSYIELEPGYYNFLYIVDGYGCLKDINKQDTLLEFLDVDPILTTENKILKTQSSPYLYRWYKDSVLIDSLSGYIRKGDGDGEYYVSITDDAGCTYPSNKITLAYPDSISIYPNPSAGLTNVLVDTDYGKYWEWHLLDPSGRKVASGLEYKRLKELDLRLQAAGIYTLVIQFESDFSKFIHRIIRN